MPGPQSNQPKAPIKITYTTVTEGFENPPYTNSYYDRALAVSYIKKYVITPNPKYMDFTNMGGDCTNFVSQMLRAGKMTFTPVSNNPTYRQWYYYGPNYGTERTATWTSAQQFRLHWTMDGDVGYKRAYRYTKYTVEQALLDFSKIHDLLWPGDVIQHADSSGLTYHSQAVLSLQGNNIIVAQHTQNTIRSLKEYLETKTDLGLSDDFVLVIQIKKGP